jgi:isopenicillin N synthase-like dioxygenase
MDRFFSSSYEVKCAAYSKSRSTRGYSDGNSENFATLIGDKKPNDSVEKFRIGPINREEAVGKPDDYYSCKEGRVFFYPNNWPEGIEGFEEDITAYYQMMSDLALTILNILEVGLNLPFNYFASHMNYPTSILGLNYYYPSISEASSDTSSHADHPFQVRIAAHTDVSLLTIVSQRGRDDMGGLEVLPHSKTTTNNNSSNNSSNSSSNSNSSNNNSLIAAAANSHASDWVKIPYNNDAFVVNIGRLTYTYVTI